jgi:DNA-binding CsgD family transcriptional regulator
MVLPRQGDDIWSVPSSPTDRKPALRPLSPRQRDVLTLLARGLSCREAARELGISSSVVHQHAMLAEAKLRAMTRSEAIAVAIERGEITPQA